MRTHKLVIASIVLAALSSTRTAAAQVQAIGSEELGRILGGMAAVIESRAREVAADVLRDELASDLCTHNATAIRVRKSDPSPLALKGRVGARAAAGGRAGLHVPVGLQVTSPYRLGVLVYPVDVGSYLVARPDSAKIQAYDAIRTGAALMFRPSARYPLDLVVSGDYRPGIGDQTPQWRYGIAVGLELPLYLIH